MPSLTICTPPGVDLGLQDSIVTWLALPTFLVLAIQLYYIGFTTARFSLSSRIRGTSTLRVVYLLLEWAFLGILYALQGMIRWQRPHAIEWHDACNSGTRDTSLLWDAFNVWAFPDSGFVITITYAILQIFSDRRVAKASILINTSAIIAVYILYSVTEIELERLYLSQWLANTGLILLLVLLLHSGITRLRTMYPEYVEW